MSPRSTPLPTTPPPRPTVEPMPLPALPDRLWNRLDLPRRRLFAQRLALLLHRRQAARQIHNQEAHHER